MMNSIASNITRARKLRGLTMEELANAINCSKQAVSLYEAGSRFPDSDVLLKISNVLNKDMDYFFSECNVDFKFNSVQYREGRQLSSSQRTEVESITSKKLNDYLELEAIAKEYVDFINPIHDLVIASTSDAERAAKMVRKRWKLGDGALPNISDSLEKKGIRIIKVDFGYLYDHAGLSGWAEDRKIPVIVLNANQTDVCRVRFTMLHELGHLLLVMSDNVGEELIERICDAFAGAMLLPAEILVQEFGKGRTVISMNELRRIKQLYGVSIAAIMVRARMTNLISYESFQKWKSGELSDRDFGMYSGIEEPQKFYQMLYHCLSEKRIGFDKASQLAGKAQDELKDYYQTL